MHRNKYFCVVVVVVGDFSRVLGNVRWSRVTFPAATVAASTQFISCAYLEVAFLCAPVLPRFVPVGATRSRRSSCSRIT